MRYVLVIAAGVVLGLGMKVGAVPACALEGQPSTKAAAKEPVLKLQGAIPLPGVKGRLDHMDIVGDRVCVAAVGNGSLEVVDIGAMAHVGSVTGLAEPHGVAAAAAWGGGSRVLVACGDGTVRAVDVKTMKEVASIKVEAGADNLRVPTLPAGMGYVADGEGAEGGLSSLDTLSLTRREGRAVLGGHPEGFVLVNRGGLGSYMPTHAYVNVAESRSVKLVELKTMTVEASWALKDTSENYPIAAGPIHHKSNSHVENWRVFVGCRRPASIVVLDGKTGAQLATMACGADVDDLFWLGSRLYAVCGGDSGSIDVFERGEDVGPGKERWVRVARMTTGPGARTGLMVDKRVGQKSRLVVALPAGGGKGAEVRVYSVE